MHSVSSASRIEHELARSPGVAQATVNLTTEEATVRYRPEAAELERAVARAGCQLRSVQVRGEDAIDPCDARRRDATKRGTWTHAARPQT